MLDNYLLQELVTFADTGTLAKTAESLNVTQPTVTRGLQKLEADFGVALFNRQPNRLTLTTTGQLAAKKAAKLLQHNHDLVTAVRNFDKTQHVLKLGTTIPGPLVLLAKQPKSDQLHIEPQLLATDDIVAALETHRDTIIFSDQNLNSDVISSQLIGTERLSVHLNKFMYQANQASITFAELKDLSFIVMGDIGPWRQIIQQAIPTAHFFYQEQRDAFSEITHYSDFPFFSTNIEPLDSAYQQPLVHDDSRVTLPITDASAQMAIYATYLTKESPQVRPLIKQMIDTFPAV
ncbi:LysR family transcriptional regulator [Lactiplantibacillus nangangensis]|uniref:LysR family transcriptional regulator n=1 Tax=Lactiplantibacillus nangangensis TaxID=2559917 RepID=A0ABW1SFQ6_9LACO|nr:LysR family transcriptional regulator [Lactiplantibacillus nangangensis]